MSNSSDSHERRQKREEAKRLWFLQKLEISKEIAQNSNLQSKNEYNYEDSRRNREHGDATGVNPLTFDERHNMLSLSLPRSEKRTLSSPVDILNMTDEELRLHTRHRQLAVHARKRQKLEAKQAMELERTQKREREEEKLRHAREKSRGQERSFEEYTEGFALLTKLQTSIASSSHDFDMAIREERKNLLDQEFSLADSIQDSVLEEFGLLPTKTLDSSRSAYQDQFKTSFDGIARDAYTTSSAMPFYGGFSSNIHASDEPLFENEIQQNEMKDSIQRSGDFSVSFLYDWASRSGLTVPLTGPISVAIQNHLANLASKRRPQATVSTQTPTFPKFS